MQKHVTDMRGLQQKLLLMGSRVDDEMLGRILLTSVKEAFPTTVEILRSREPSPTLSQITNRLLAKEILVNSGTPTKRNADPEHLLYSGKPDKPRPFKKQVVKDKCHYCHKIGHHAFECRFKKRDLANGITRKCMPTEDEDQINVLQHDEDEGFILATMDDVARSDLEDSRILDSACTADVTGNKTLFTKLARTQASAMQPADNSTVPSMHVGLLSIQVDEDHRLDRPETKYVQKVKKSLLACRLLLKDGFQVAKWNLNVAIMIRDTFVLRFIQHRRLQSTPKLVQWHLRLAHLNFGAIKQAARDGVVVGLYLSKSDVAQDYNCEVCEVAKARRMSYKNTKPVLLQDYPLEDADVDDTQPQQIAPMSVGAHVNQDSVGAPDKAGESPNATIEIDQGQDSDPDPDREESTSSDQEKSDFDVECNYPMGLEAASSGHHQSFEDIEASPNKQAWLDATQEEYNSLVNNGTWVLTDLPSGRKALACKGLWRNKFDAVGRFTKYKARHVIKGFLQRHDLDYMEIFAPVLCYNTLRLVIFLV
ncbi:Aste57867_17147 [Aphanomyces stellatus]|uniref:Aste57867_17147 protein n=1 Tax=Aphanomyces stellatus TaxID=120398 RepID=A0A485L8L9_9STRA|nr:hypothetical protein As57867_017088 [Aphanomyces stellatus]VFT93904.1 Aste57867_17147 [Aphanomyces stellatus]